MSVKTVINETYQLLNGIGAVSSRKEFYKNWLNRSDSYMRVINFYQKSPSTNSLAVCSSKLKYYANLLKEKEDKQSRTVANDFNLLSQKFDNLIFKQSTNEWIEKEKKQKEKDAQIHILN